MSVMEINSFNYLIHHDFEKAKENNLALGVFVKNEESYLKEVSVANPLNKLRWANHIKIREITKYVKKRIKEGIALQGIENLWIDRDNIPLKRQYAVLDRMDPSFSNPLKETLIIQMCVPFVDEFSTVKNPKFLCQQVLTIKFDELTELSRVAKKVSCAFLTVKTKTYDREISVHWEVLNLSDSEAFLQNSLMSFEGTLAGFLRANEFNNELSFSYEGFNIPQLEISLKKQGEKDGGRAGNLCGKTGNPRPPHPDLSPEEAAKLSFGLDCYYKSYKKAFYQGFEEGAATKESQDKKESCTPDCWTVKWDSIIDRSSASGCNSEIGDSIIDRQNNRKSFNTSEKRSRLSNEKSSKIMETVPLVFTKNV